MPSAPSPGPSSAAPESRWSPSCSSTPATPLIASYGVSDLHLTRNDVLGATAVAGFFYTVFTVFSAVTSDRFGRKPLIAGAQLLGVLWALALFPLLNTGSVGFFYIAMSVTYAIAGLANGAIAAFLPEQFQTSYRYTAAGVSYNIGGIIGGGIAPLIAPLIIAGSSSFVFGCVLAGLSLIAALCTLSLRETKNKTMEWDNVEELEAESV